MSQQCSVCGCDLTVDTGWGVSTTLADGAPITLYCGECDPNKGRGYTLSDLQGMKAENQVQRDLHQVSLMDRLGPDVYFAVKDKQERAERRQKMRRYHDTMSSVVSTLKRIGVIGDDLPPSSPQP